ncbi:hypothetical protein [Cryobacterium sp. PH31-O1]|uniref:hypothetical protein n=1 Tax=Cryobacterium sp. PH31-O1 TaxID=3046306 RepID=UPI0024BAEFD8|nr:hypothetical protein [Cryobacterium sp. PH31-O1]MDJ0338446.1 hypothetical protein [Cryobacterium sp. PH31-O1]
MTGSRAALAQALHSIADQIPMVHIEPGYTAVTPDGAVGFGAPPHLAVGEAGSGGSALHSIADRVAPPAAAAAPPVAAHVDAHVDVTPTADAPAGAIDDVAPDAAPDGPGSGGASNGSEPDGQTSENAGTGEASGSDLDPNAGIGTAPVQADFQVPGTTKTIDYVAYHETLAASVHNADALEVMLGKWDGGKPGNYVEMGEAGGYEYFSLGAEWDPIKKAQGLDDSDMFNAYNMPFLDDAIASGKTFHFSHDPRFDEGALFREFKYLEASGYRYDPVAMTALPRSARL